MEGGVEWGGGGISGTLRLCPGGRRVPEVVCWPPTSVGLVRRVRVPLHCHDTSVPRGGGITLSVGCGRCVPRVGAVLVIDTTGVLWARGLFSGGEARGRGGGAGPHAHRNTARQATDGLWTAQTVERPPQQPAQPQYANYWAPLTRTRHIPPHPAQPRHTNCWALRTRKRHQQEHRPQRPTERSDPTQRAKGRPGDCPGPRHETTTRRNVTRGGGGGGACLCAGGGGGALSVNFFFAQGAHGNAPDELCVMTLWLCGRVPCSARVQQQPYPSVLGGGGGGRRRAGPQSPVARGFGRPHPNSPNASAVPSGRSPNPTHAPPAPKTGAKESGSGARAQHRVPRSPRSFWGVLLPRGQAWAVRGGGMPPPPP